MVRRRKKAIVEDKWEEYFHKIQDVCPWSLSAWRKGCIIITQWDGNVQDLNADEACVYIHKHASARLLKKIHNRLNTQYPQYEFLWSHPSYKHNSAPYACIIQQDRTVLNTIRHKLYK